ncbi:MAG TPA: hypothetical protein VJZ27_18445, partial [Aggregatilineales bacterium]|nr:hypothetical protein [Aggregatilineales bacterium]
MSKSNRKRYRNPSFILATAIGIIMILTFVISLVSPGTQSGSNTVDDAVDPNEIPTLIPTQITIPTPEDNPVLTAN